MVNLFEPFLVSLLKQRAKPTTSQKDLSSLSKLQGNQAIDKIVKREPHITQIKEKIPLRYPEVKSSFFSEQKTTHWLEVLKDQDTKSGNLSHHWNFLFPEIPWSEERLYWQHERNRSLFYGTLTSKNDSFLLCVLFDSIRTGKVWIYLEYQAQAEKSSSVFFQTERESTKRKIERDRQDLENELKVLGKIRILVETSNDNYVKMTHIRSGVLA